MDTRVFSTMVFVCKCAIGWLNYVGNVELVGGPFRTKWSKWPQDGPAYTCPRAALT